MENLPGQVAEHIFSKALPLKKGSSVVIETWDGNEAIAKAVELEARARRHSVVTLFNDSATFAESANKLPKGAKTILGRHEIALLKNTDGYVFIPGAEISFASTSLTPEKFSAATAYNMDWYKTVEGTKLKGVRLVAGYFNTEKAASILGKRREEITDHLLNASLANPAELKKKGKAVFRAARTGKKLTLESEGGKLTFKAGKEEELDDGRTDDEDLRAKSNMSNLPGGYCVKAASGQTEGTVRCSTISLQGKRMPPLSLEFSGGKIVSYSAEGWDDAQREKFDKYIKGSKNRALTYFAVGLNPLLKKGYGRDMQAAGSTAIWIGPSANALVENPTLSSADGEIVSSGDLAI